MVNKQNYKSATVAANWWLDAIKNGLELASDLPCELKALYNLTRLKSSYSEETLKKLHNAIINNVNKDLNENDTVTLYTQTYPKGILRECSIEAYVLYKLDNPFPENISMQVTKNSVIVKGKNFETILLHEEQLER